ncbi:MAG: homoserine kinase [Chloroflexi bacterium]|nr:homoserine kinase [Chloroflexota bacterium]
MLTVRAPATSANLGPGYDCLSLALDVANVVEAWPAADGVSVEVVGEGAALLPGDASNEVYRALSVVYARHGTPPPPLRMRCHNVIPPSRGLGSSSAARACGLLLANRLLGEPFSPERLFEIGTELEGHPDNIAACLFGGVQVCVTGRNGLEHLQVPVAFPLATTVYIPDFPMDTHRARGLLPTDVPVPTAVFNISRSSLFVGALATGRTDLLRTATEDAIHQPPRSTIFPALPILIAAALDAGAYGAFLSGAGSSVMALVAPDAAETIGAAMAAAARQANVPGRLLQAAISTSGAHIEGSPPNSQ